MDIATIGAALGSLKTGVDMISAAGQLARSLGSNELADKLAAAQNTLLDARNQVSDMRDELDAQRREVTRLNDALAFKETIEFDPVEQAYRLVAQPDVEFGRFCAHCWDGERKVSRLQVQHRIGDMHVKINVHSRALWYCPSCKTHIARKGGN